MLDNITPVVLTFDEAPNIDRTLSMLHWAKDIVIVDSFSTDETIIIAQTHPNVRIFQRRFDSHASQWNYAVKETGIKTEWVLALDADYVLSSELVDELKHLTPRSNVAGFQTSFQYCVSGQPLRGNVYTPVTTLFRVTKAYYEQDGHTQRIRVGGELGLLRGLIKHDDRKPLGRWLRAQNRYMELEARKLRSTPLDNLGFADRVRRQIVIAPVLMFFYCAFFKGNILDGKAGLYYSFQRTLAELLLSLYLLQLRLVTE